MVFITSNRFNSFEVWIRKEQKNQILSVKVIVYSFLLTVAKRKRTVAKILKKEIVVKSAPAENKLFFRFF
jgi:hypothetical protein